MKRKVLVITGTRAEYGLLRSTMDAIRASRKLELKILVTGMHTLRQYGFTKKEIENDGYQIDCVVFVKEGSSMLGALVQELEGIAAYCVQSRPDCVLVLGDRDEPLAAAIVATHLGIPLAHLHGGDATGARIDEQNRAAITAMAQLHFPATDRSAARVRRLGADPECVFRVGTPALDGLKRRAKRKDLAKKLGLDEKRPWLTLLMHPNPLSRVKPERQIAPALAALTRFSECEKVIVYPNSDTGSEVFIRRIKKMRGEHCHIFKSVPRALYLDLVRESDALVGNSSAGLIETPSLGTSSVNIGERQAGRERGESVIDVPYDAGRIAAAIQKAVALKRSHRGPFSSPYGRPGAGKRIVRILERELNNRRIDKRA